MILLPIHGVEGGARKPRASGDDPSMVNKTISGRE